MGRIPIDYSTILQRLQLRDRKAFDELYLATRVTLYVIAFDILEEETAAQDLVQDFFIDFWQQELSKNVESNLKGYLFRSIHNRALSLKKKWQVRQRGESSMPHPEMVIQPSNIEQAQLGNAISRALEKVPKGAAEIFLLHYSEAISHADIADKLAISPHTVRNQIAKALRILREELKNSR